MGKYHIRGLMTSFTQLNFQSCAKKKSYLRQFAAETNETWQKNSSTGDTL